jgi:hypothetical protein
MNIRHYTLSLLERYCYSIRYPEAIFTWKGGEMR